MSILQHLMPYNPEHGQSQALLPQEAPLLDLSAGYGELQTAVETAPLSARIKI